MSDRNLAMVEQDLICSDKFTEHITDSISLGIKYTANLSSYWSSQPMVKTPTQSLMKYVLATAQTWSSGTWSCNSQSWISTFPALHVFAWVYWIISRQLHVHWYSYIQYTTHNSYMYIHTYMIHRMTPMRLHWYANIFWYTKARRCMIHQHKHH